MFIIKLDAIDSTNSYLKAMTSAGFPKDFTVVVTELQTQGRGQMGTVWKADYGKNLTASVFKKVSFLKTEEQFYISMVVSLAIYDALKALRIPQLSIKWPNDILSANKKLCGILIENVIKNNQLQGTVIGFGLNINQKNFESLPSASSMKNLTGITYAKDEVLTKILNNFQSYFKLLEDKDFDNIKSQYENFLFRKDKPSTFQIPSNNIFSGIINGISEQGQLRVWTEDDIIRTFEFKEVTLLY
ncbi:biotin--[acetyl-CoA-carboxylase] ligase [Winogradskyella sp.]|uniref:biotin--[acetyl-CoA-carboxylase] ligase n=1 Tax=Winogradskyella sp. TaxID=1883156 RepID=UPI003F6BBAD5